MRRILLGGLVSLLLMSLFGCVRHTYTVELTDGEFFYVDPPLILDTKTGLYSMSIHGTRRTVPMEDVAFIDDAAQICFQNDSTDTFSCFDALYQY